MKNYFDIDFRRFSLLLLPTILRSSLIASFVLAFAEPVKLLYNSFTVNRNANLYRLSITPQVCYLEKALNDRFSSWSRLIYITDGNYKAQMYIYTRTENYPRYIYTKTEALPRYLYQRGEAGADNYDFIVHVPSWYIFDENEMRALVDMYKLANKNYEIKRF